MGSFSIFSELAAVLKKNRLLAYALYGAAALLALSVFISPLLKKDNAKTQKTVEQAAQTPGDTAEEIEKRLEEILSCMRGAGRVKVMLTLDRTDERVLATNDKTSSGGASVSSESRPATVSSSGSEEPIVLTELLPRIRGVIVMAEGASDFTVRSNIIAAVSVVLGVDEKCVEVFVMG